MKRILGIGVFLVLCFGALFFVFALHALGPTKEAPQAAQEVPKATQEIPVQNSNGSIIVSEPRKNAQIASPVVIKGEAKGNWFFEASFPVSLADSEGNTIAQGTAAAQGDWMTANFVPFTAELSFSKPAKSNKGSLILKKDNPSGLPENDDSIEIPVIFQ